MGVCEVRNAGLWQVGGEGEKQKQKQKHQGEAITKCRAASGRFTKDASPLTIRTLFPCLVQLKSMFRRLVGDNFGSLCIRFFLCCSLVAFASRGDLECRRMIRE